MGNNPGDVQFVQVATTFDAVEEAEALASSAVKARLAACAQAEGPVTSVYRWDGAVQKDEEWRVTFKTTVALADQLTEYIVREHSYDVPELLVTPSDRRTPEVPGVDSERDRAGVITRMVDPRGGRPSARSAHTKLAAHQSVRPYRCRSECAHHLVACRLDPRLL